jgi:membrane protease YdiL (CAAX protease family)
MNSFLFPKEGRNTITYYIISLISIFIGTYVIGTSIAFIPISMNVPISEINKGGDWTIYFSKNQSLVINLIPFFMGVLCVFLAAYSILKRPLLSLITSRSKIDYKRVGFAFVLFFILLTIQSLISFIIDPTTVKYNFSGGQFFLLLMIGLFGISLQTLFEELLFRGFLLQFGSLLFRKGILAIISSSIVFMSMHFANPEVERLGLIAIVYYIVSGVFASIIAVMDEGFELAWGFHFANNFFVVVLFNTTWGALPTDSLFLDLSKPEASIYTLIFPLVTFPLLLFLFSRKYKWENWKSKLF